MILVALSCAPLSVDQLAEVIPRSRFTITKSVLNLVHLKEVVIDGRVRRTNKVRGPIPYMYRLKDAPHEPQRFWVSANQPVLKPVIKLRHGEKIVAVELDQQTGNIKFCIEAT